MGVFKEILVTMASHETYCVRLRVFFGVCILQCKACYQVRTKNSLL